LYKNIIFKLISLFLKVPTKENNETDAKRGKIKRKTKTSGCP
jgi:hypothetical protein